MNAIYDAIWQKQFSALPAPLTVSALTPQTNICKSLVLSTCFSFFVSPSLSLFSVQGGTTLCSFDSYSPLGRAGRNRIKMDTSDRKSFGPACSSHYGSHGTRQLTLLILKKNTVLCRLILYGQRSILYCWNQDI